jgi:hypothetical protein
LRIAESPQSAISAAISIDTPNTPNSIVNSADRSTEPPIVRQASEETVDSQVTVGEPAISSSSTEESRVVQARVITLPDDSTWARPAVPAELRSVRAGSRLSGVDGDAGEQTASAKRQNLNPARLAAQVGLALAEQAAEVGTRLDAVLAPAPIVFDLFTSVVVVDLPSLELAVRNLMDEVDDLGAEVADTLTSVRLTTWLTIFAATAAAFEGVRLIARRSRGGAVLATGPGGEPSSWPDSVGRPPEGLR